MGEEQNQSVRYSQMMSYSSHDSFETSSTQLLVTKSKEIKTSIRHKTLLGVALCVILLTVLIISLKKSSGNTTSTIETKIDDTGKLLATTIN